MTQKARATEQLNDLCREYNAGTCPYYGQFFDRLVEILWRPLSNAIYVTSRGQASQTVIEDVIIETIDRLHTAFLRKTVPFEGGAIMAWALTTARNAAIDAYRKAKGQRSEIPLENAPEPSAPEPMRDNWFVQAVLGDALMDLTLLQRQTLLMTNQGFTAQQIADMQTPPVNRTAIEKRLDAAKAHMRRNPKLLALWNDYYANKRTRTE